MCAQISMFAFPMREERVVHSYSDEFVKGMAVSYAVQLARKTGAVAWAKRQGTTQVRDWLKKRCVIWMDVRRACRDAQWECAACVILMVDEKEARTDVFARMSRVFLGDDDPAERRATLVAQVDAKLFPPVADQKTSAVVVTASDRIHDRVAKMYSSAQHGWASLRPPEFSDWEDLASPDAFYLQPSVKDVKQALVAKSPDSKSVSGGWDNGFTAISPTAFTMASAARTPTPTPNSGFAALRFKLQVKTLNGYVSRLKDDLYASLHVTSTVAPMRSLCLERHCIRQNGKLFDAELCVEVQADACPRGVMLHVELYTQNYDAKHTRLVYPRVCFGWTVLDTLVGSKQPRTIVMSGEDSTRVGNPTGRCVVELRHVAGTVSFDAKRVVAPRIPTKTREDLFKLYVRASEWTGKSKATYPSGTPYRAGDLSSMVDTCLGPMPLLFYYYNSESTDLGPIENVNRVVDTLVRMTCIEFGLTMEQYQFKVADRLFQCRFLGRMLRRLPSLLAFATDIHGDSWTVPTAAESLMHESLDCEELAAMCGLATKYLRTSTTDLAMALRARLKDYTGMYTIITSRNGPDNVVSADQDQLHAVYWLMPKAYLKWLERPVGDTKMESPDPQLPVLHLECLADVQALRHFAGTRMVAHSELGIVSAFLGRTITGDEGVTRKYVGSIITAFVIDDGDVRQLNPYCEGRHGLSVDAVWNHARIPESRLSRAAAVTPALLEAAVEIRNEARHYNNIHVRDSQVQLDNAFVDRLAAYAIPLYSRVFFTLYDEVEARQPLRKRLDLEVAATKARAKQRGVESEFAALKAQVLESEVYIMDGVTAAIVQLTNSPEGATAAPSGGRKDRAL
jgi:hypothetical protein